MKKEITFEEVLEAADRLPAEEQEIIIDILRKRIIEQRRKEIIKEVKASRTEFLQGLCRPASPGEIIAEILS
jgi:hypothetical protein